MGSGLREAIAEAIISIRIRSCNFDNVSQSVRLILHFYGTSGGVSVRRRSEGLRFGLKFTGGGRAVPGGGRV